MASPKWATRERQNHLVSIFLRSRGFCVFGHTNCPIPAHYYDIYIENLIADWKADDRREANDLWKAEQKQLHSLGERRTPLRGEFSAISRDISGADKPQFYLLGLGISGLTFTPFAKVRLSSTYVNLYVELGDTLGKVSKSKRRKAIRYGKPLPLELDHQIRTICKSALDHFLEH